LEVDPRSLLLSLRFFDVDSTKMVGCLQMLDIFGGIGGPRSETGSIFPQDERRRPRDRHSEKPE